MVPKAKPSFADKIPQPLRAERLDVLQVNLGYRCNLKCRHCHVEAGSARPETMSFETMEQCLQVLKYHPIPVLDITGGSPELHPQFPWFLKESAALSRRVMVRSNGIVLLETEHEPLLDLYADCHVEVVLSLPHLDPRVTDRQRGEGVFSGLIEVMRRLNARGYGEAGSGLVVDLVHNPVGAYLPGSQTSIESQYRHALGEQYGVTFNRLFTITNMPVGRYLYYLVQTDNCEEYMQSLVKAFNPAALSGVMCKSTVSVGWDGKLYDCDFNQVLGLTIDHGAPDHIEAFAISALKSREIVVGNHCYGCTAGSGSSCQGQTT